jgi:hypothetical protein
MMSNIAIFPVGNAAVILDEARQLLFSLDARSAFAWCCLAEGCERHDLVDVFVLELNLDRAEAECEVNRVIRSFSDLGLLDDHRDDRTEGPERRQPRPERQDNSTAASIFCRIKLLDTIFEIRFPCTRLLDQFRTVMGHLEIDSGACDSVVTVHDHGDGYTIFVDDNDVEHCGSYKQVAPQVMSLVSAEAVNRATFAACLHSAVLTWGKQAILIPGPSGAGKSCLTLTLAHAGFTCLSDEKALLDPETLQVRGVPLACCVKEGGWRAMAEFNPTLPEVEIHTRGDGKRVKYLNLVSQEAAARSWPVAHIVFPVYREGITARRSPVDPAEALHRLLSSCMAWRVRLTPKFVEKLIAWVEQSQCHELRYGSNSDALMEISGLLGRGDAPRENVSASQPSP